MLIVDGDSSGTPFRPGHSSILNRAAACTGRCISHCPVPAGASGSLRRSARCLDVAAFDPHRHSGTRKSVNPGLAVPRGQAVRVPGRRGVHEGSN